MTIPKIMERMIALYQGSIHDIDHMLRVWSYVKTIGELERLDQETQLILEAAAITHDIACPLCREKYGNTDGCHQEEEGAPMARQFLSDSGMTEAQVDRVAYLVGHHHTLSHIDGIDLQILAEADYIANTEERGYSRQNIGNFIHRIMKTESGARILKSVFRI